MTKRCRPSGATHSSSVAASAGVPIPTTLTAEANAARKAAVTVENGDSLTCTCAICSSG